MSAVPPRIETPLGSLALQLDCGGETTDPAAAEASRVGPHAGRWLWPDVGGLRVDLVVTDFPFPERGSDAAVAAAAGAVWTLTALRDSDDVLVEATLPQAGSRANGECLEALEFETADWLLAVGGPDDDCLGRGVEAGLLPESWRGRLRAGSWDTGYGAVDRGPGTLAWTLPGLRAGESAVHHVAAAWRANDGDEQYAVAPWLAVDTSAEALLRASTR